MRALAAVVVVALLAAAASAQPCIPCSACTTDHCLRHCSASCPTPYVPITPDQVVVSGDRCKHAGTAYGPTAASAACETTKRYCSAGYQAPAVVGAVGPVTLLQCSDIAFGVCQSTACSSWACTTELMFGYGQCSRDQFTRFFKGEVAGQCRNWARTVTDVDPGTHQWVIGSAGPSGRRL